MDLVINEVNNLSLQHLDEGWVQAVYASEFLDFVEIPPEYEITLDTFDLTKIFKNIMNSCDTVLSSDSLSHEEKSWAALSHLVPHKKMLAFLGYYIDLGIKNVASKEKRNNALLASLVYYKLLSIPGYKAYHIYHSQLFTLSLACLGFPKAMCDNEQNFLNTKELTREVNSVIDSLKQFVVHLKAIIEQLQLNATDMNFEDILSNLVDIIGGAIVNKLNVDKIELVKVSNVIYEIIDILLCDPNGEPNPAAIRLLFKCLLPKFISASTDSRSANSIVRASYVTYSGLLLSKYGKAALPGYNVLLQHLCYTLDGLERAEVRGARVSLVVGLMSLLPKKSHRQTVRWILKLSTTAKVPHRHVAMEILASLLTNDPEEVKQKIGTKNRDSLTSSDSNGDKSIDQPKDDTEKQVLPEDESQPQDSVVTEDESSQDTLELFDQDVAEEELAGLLRQRAHTVCHAEILRAIYERINDVSSTLRARAYNILSDCLTHAQQHVREAVKELRGTGPGAGPGACRLVAASARGVCDERAAVRRAALTVLQRVVALDAQPAHNDLAILVGLCRDASIIVRSAAIASLGDMVTQIRTEEVFDAFLNGPVHQLSDPENKIQELVVNQIQQLLTDRIDTYVSIDIGDPLPWMFLEGITRHNMKRHLLKACTLLAKNSNCINHRFVDVVSTHLGAADDRRDLQCLVMLTSVARHVEYSDISFVLDYYYKLADDDSKSRDVRLMPLTVELLTVWSRFATNQQRNSLREHLVKRLATSEDETCRIPLVTLAAQLDPDNLHWATEMMQLSERRALTGGGVWEWVRAADLSLVAPAAPTTALQQLFLDALTNPPLEWGCEEMGACVAGVGRLCVRSRTAACRAAPCLAALLRDSAVSTTARLNALLVLTDICTRYTSIVEPLLECVCGCLARASPPELRRAAARALTRLLLAGFLRLRTPLYYKYCALLADEDRDVREPAEYYMTCCLTTDTIFHHFVDCVLYYNNEKDKLSFDARQLIYDVMLQRMSLVQKLNTQCRIAREVLEHAADLTDEGDGDLPDEINAALLDTITILCGPRMKLPKKPPANGEADIDDLQERVTTNIVSHKMKRTVAEVVVPAVLRLYSRLSPRGGQLAAYLVKLATDLLNDYRQEIEELIENDEELVERINQFQETIGIESSFGNSRNLVTASAPPDPETPRAPRRKATKLSNVQPKKRALKI